MMNFRPKNNAEFLISNDLPNKAKSIGNGEELKWQKKG